MKIMTNVKYKTGCGYEKEREIEDESMMQIQRIISTSNKSS